MMVHLPLCWFIAGWDSSMDGRERLGVSHGDVGLEIGRLSVTGL